MLPTVKPTRRFLVLGPWAAGRGRHLLMSQHIATISWKNTGTEFLQGRFSRAHTWTFDGGLTVPASAAPSVVRPPLSDPSAVDPEEAFVAALSSCHMLTFLHFARKAGFQVASYDDAAIGEMTKNERGVPFISTVKLNPRIVYDGDKQPSPEELHQLHHEAHEQCFIAQSVKTEVTVNDPPA
jgi:organic hydroperoxide reductase OsmC/OhrA